MKKTSQSHHSSLNELNITPLLDLAFVLLVIFIITTPQLSNDIEMSLPSARKTPPATNQPPPKLNYIVVNQSGQITLNGQILELGPLKETLDAMQKGDTNTSVVVRGAADVDYQRVISVLDIIQQVDITRVGLATETVQ